jgi:hypothetical protein
MRNQARRLWFGDSQRGEDEPTQAAGHDDSDTVVITPVDDSGAPLRPEPRRRIQPRTAILLGLAALCAFGFGLASGGGDKKQTAEGTQAPPAQTPQFQTPQAQPQTPPAQTPQGVPPQGFGGADLTGPEAEKAARAALSKFPGAIERVTRGPNGGGYIVHVIQETGEVHVLVGDDFDVEGSDAGRAAPPQGFSPGTPGTSQ